MNSLYKLQMVHRKYSIFILILSILRDTKAAVENVRLNLKGRWKGEVGKANENTGKREWTVRNGLRPAE